MKTYKLSDSSIYKNMNDKSLLFHFENDDYILEFSGKLSTLPELLSNGISSDELSVKLGLSAQECSRFLSQIEEVGLLNNSKFKGFAPDFSLHFANGSIEAKSFDSLVPQDITTEVHASYCACNCCSYCDNCTCSDC